jgi:hypothetical protein
MQATQSSTASGTWCRTEQFAALRYISRHLDAEMGASTAATGKDYDFDFEIESGSRIGSDADAGWGAARLAGDAAELLQPMRRCHDLLTDEAISFAERGRCTAELELLRNRCWELMDRYLRRGGEPRAVRGREFAQRRERAYERLSGWNYGRDGFRPVCAEGFAGARVETLPGHRLKLLKRGAAGWIAC